MSNLTAAPGKVLACPLLQLMIDHNLNNNTRANIVLVCIHGMVSCLGILENALIIWVVGFRLQRRTVASVWVLNLAISDFLATLTLPLFTYYLSSNHSWELVLNPILYAFSCPNFCVRIRQSLTAVFEGLVEEGGGILLVPGKSLRAHIQRKNSEVQTQRYQQSQSQSTENQSPVKSNFNPNVLAEEQVEEERATGKLEK
uniref:G-protein coupled receptors family 1 profile domain-containing protein n=1 Tax=Knipowitschia caucasica TaxID=637954 RepID=A0AAV2LNN2_KNICA